MKRVLGIETSCDETAVAVVAEDKTILSHHILSQIKQHQPYGGVVPEIASRAHMDVLDTMIKAALAEANIAAVAELDAIAVTAGPGLIGGVIVGVMMAKGMAAVSGVPLIGVNHLEGHALTVRLTENVEFPFLLLLVSGGHCQILHVKGVGQYTQLGGTMDDALGEAFDKVAKMMGLGYPGGPIVERYAIDGDTERFSLPRALITKPGYDFSFSGLKTAVKRHVDRLSTEKTMLSDRDKKDICASFQQCVADILQDRLRYAMQQMKHLMPAIDTLVVAGGVAANQFLLKHLQDVTTLLNFRLVSPPLKLCTDNAAMIAWAGLERLQLGLVDDLHLVPRARWPLDNAY